MVHWPLSERRGAGALLQNLLPRIKTLANVNNDDGTVQGDSLAPRDRTYLDGILAKRRDLGCRSGDRTGLLKIKDYRSADCVVAGFRYTKRLPIFSRKTIVP